MSEFTGQYYLEPVREVVELKTSPLSMIVLIPVASMRLGAAIASQFGIEPNEEVN